MERQKITEMLAEWFGIEADENGEYDINDYDWREGCSMGYRGQWLNLAEVVECIEANF